MIKMLREFLESYIDRNVIIMDKDYNVLENGKLKIKDNHLSIISWKLYKGRIIYYDTFFNFKDVFDILLIN